MNEPLDHAGGEKQSSGNLCDLPSVGTHELYSLSVSAIAPQTQTQLTAGCAVCGSKQAVAVFQILQTPYSIIDCCECRTGLIDPPPSVDEIRSFYPDDYYGDDGSKFSTIIEPLVRLIGARRAWFIARLLPPSGTVLDVGCGRGVLLQSLADSGRKVFGFEISAGALTGIDRRVRTAVASSLAAAGYAADQFDGVVIWHVLEHVSDPRGVLEEVLRITRPGGVVIVAVPNYSSIQARLAGPAWFHLDPPRHLFQFSVTGLKSLVADAGFVVESEHHFSLRQNPFGWIQSFQNRLRWLPRNGLYSLLHRRHTGDRLPFSGRVRWQLRVCFLAGLLPALLLSIVAAIFRSGATVHLVARKPRSAMPR